MVTGGIVEYDPQLGHYSLPPEHAGALTRSAPLNLSVFAEFIPLLGSVEDGIVECFKNGGGLGYEAFPRFQEVMAELSAQTVLAALTDSIVPLVPGLSEDLERVAKMRQTLGPDFPLMVDANMRWRVDEAIRASRALAEHDVYWLEEPTIPDDVAGHVEIVRQGALPVAAGENLHSLYEFKNYIHAGAVSFPEPDCSNCGGVTGYLKIAHLAEAHNLPVTTHGIHDIHVHLLAAVPNSSYLEVHGFGLEPYMANPLRIEHGEALAPDRPGHGVELDWKALEAYRGAP